MVGRLVTVLLTVGAMASTVGAQAFRTESGTAEFTSSVPLHSFTGSSEVLAGRIDLAERTVDFYVDLETLDTGIGKRDKDMRQTLETSQFPFAEFFGSLVGTFDPASPDAQAVQVQGRFTLHGVERDVEVSGTLQSVPGGIRVIAEWSLRLDDYGIEPPRLLMIKVDPVQQLRIDAVLSPEQAESQE